MGPVQDEAEKNDLTSIQISKRTKSIADRAATRFGTPRTWLVTRLLEWWEAQPDDVKQAFIDASRDPGAAIAQQRLTDLDRMAGKYELHPPSSIEEATRIVRHLMDQIDQMSRQKVRELKEQRPADPRLRRAAQKMGRTRKEG